jgi:hypothetical protein
MADDKIWIELERGTEAEMKQRAEKANKLLQKINPRLGVQFLALGDRGYVLDSTDGSGYLELTNNGHWFNLDILIR